MSYSLLDDLAGEEGVFISDLKNQLLYADTIAALKKINMENYGIDEWNDGLSYIFGKNFTFDNYKQIQTFLIDYTIEEN